MPSATRPVGPPTFWDNLNTVLARVGGVSAEARAVRAVDSDRPGATYTQRLVARMGQPFTPYDIMGQPMRRVPQGRATDASPAPATYTQYLVSRMNGDRYAAALATATDGTAALAAQVAQQTPSRMNRAGLLAAIFELDQRIEDDKALVAGLADEIRESGTPRTLRHVARVQAGAAANVGAALTATTGPKREPQRFADIDTGRAPDPNSYASTLKYMGDLYDYLENRRAVLAAELERRSTPTKLRRTGNADTQHRSLADLLATNATPTHRR